MIANERGSCREVEYGHFVGECRQEAAATFTKVAALSWKTASSPVASEKRGSHFRDQMLRVFNSSVSDKVLLNIRVHIEKKNSYSSDFLLSKPVLTRDY